MTKRTTKHADEDDTTILLLLYNNTIKIVAISMAVCLFGSSSQKLGS